MNYQFNGMGMGGFSTPKKRLNPAILISIIAGVAIIIIVIVAILCSKTSVEFEVTQLYWERVINIDRLTTVEESGWSVPPGGRVLYTTWEFYRYETYEERYYDYDEDEYYYEEYQEPVYATKYHYEIERWLDFRDVMTCGYDKNAYWGEYRLEPDERVCDRVETYWIYGLDSKGKSHKYEITQSAWAVLSEGDMVNGEVDVFGNLVSLHRS